MYLPHLELQLNAKTEVDRCLSELLLERASLSWAHKVHVDRRVRPGYLALTESALLEEKADPVKTVKQARLVKLGVLDLRVTKVNKVILECKVLQEATVPKGHKEDKG